MGSKSFIYIVILNNNNNKSLVMFKCSNVPENSFSAGKSGLGAWCASAAPAPSNGIFYPVSNFLEHLEHWNNSFCSM